MDELWLIGQIPSDALLIASAIAFVVGGDTFGFGLPSTMTDGAFSFR